MGPQFHSGPIHPTSLSQAHALPGMGLGAAMTGRGTLEQKTGRRMTSGLEPKSESCETAEMYLILAEAPWKAFQRQGRSG